jgi:peptidoglycan/LPS O-acetylase OafA/YrhL
MFIRSTLKKFPWGDDFLFSFLSTTTLTIIAATFVYKYFEQPIIRFYKTKFSPAPAPVAASPAVPVLL